MTDTSSGCLINVRSTYAHTIQNIHSDVFHSVNVAVLNNQSIAILATVKMAVVNIHLILNKIIVLSKPSGFTTKDDQYNSG